MKKTLALFFVLSVFIFVKAQDTTINKIALLPLISNGIDLASVQTAESILRLELSKASTMSIISEKKTLAALDNQDCTDEECAIGIGEKLEAKQVLLCKLNPLGEKIIIQYILVETATGKNILSESATSVNLEDIDAVMKRVAISVSKQTPFNTNQEVGNIVEKESIESLRQKARYNFGVGFGYLFPSDGYDNDNKKSFTINAYFDYEINDVAAGLMIGARKGFAINLYGNYLFSRTNVCPYLGGSLGFHWVAHENWLFGNENKDGDGIELGLQGGVRLFHTYNFQMFVQCEYIMTFNDYNDKAIVFTIGIL
jgi:hypothetical protein